MKQKKGNKDKEMNRKMWEENKKMKQFEEDKKISNPKKDLLFYICSILFLTKTYFILITWV
jgi:type IV secretory pathway component VirB8